MNKATKAMLIMHCIGIEWYIHSFLHCKITFHPVPFEKNDRPINISQEEHCLFKPVLNC